MNENLMESLKHRKGAGAPFRISIEDLQTCVKAVPFHFCKNSWTLAYKVGIPATTIRRALKVGCLKTSMNNLKPFLTPKNQADCVAYCCSFVDTDSWFSDMMDCVDIDETWFYLSEEVTKYILVPGEVPPHRTCKHKSHIVKSMCLTAIAHLRKDPVTGVWWDGKIGTWFFVKQVPAQRTSKNRPVGTIETKSVSINKKEINKMILDNLFPAILEKWPAWERKRIRIQLDNAPAHPKPGKLSKGIAKRLVEYSDLGCNINFSTQPPNLDLAFF